MATKGHPIDVLTELSSGDKVRLHFDDSHHTSRYQPDSPWDTTVRYSISSRKDHQKGHDVDGIVTETEVYFEVPPKDDDADEYYMIHKSPMVGDESVSILLYKEDLSGKHYATGGIAGVSKIEVLP